MAKKPPKPGVILQVLLLGALLCGAGAVTQSVAQTGSVPGPAASERKADSQLRVGVSPCRCRYQGRSHALGAIVCMDGLRYRCELEQNVTTWRRLGPGCPSAATQGTPRS